MSEIATTAPTHPIWDHIKAAPTPAELVERARGAVELVDRRGCSNPIPAFMLDLPWLDDPDAIVEGILVNLITADDIVAATKPADLRTVEDIAGQMVTVVDIGIRPSEVRDAKWGAYATLMVKVGDRPAEVVNTGAEQALITLWRCWCESRFPVKGRFVLLGKERADRSQPVGFDVAGER